MKRFGLAVSLLVLMTSCEYRFDVSSPVAGTRMFVEGIIGLEDTDYIRVQKAVPVGKDAQDGDSYEVESIVYTEDGRAHALEKIDTLQFYAAHGTPAPGSVLRFSLSTKGEPAVSAITTVPDVPQASWTCTVINGTAHWKMTVDSPEDRYYALMCYGRYEFEDGEYWGATTVSADQAGTSYYETLTAQLRQTTWVSAYEPYRLTVLRGDELSGGTFAFATDGTGSAYRMVLLGLSEEAYSYLNAKYNKENNMLAMIGLSPANFAYTNVEGGYGVFAAVSRTEETIQINQ